MPKPDLVRVRIGNRHTTVGAAHAAMARLELVETESAVLGDGRTRPDSRANGRPDKPKTTVTDAVAAKQAVKPADAPKEKQS